MRNIILATGNPGKIKEFELLFKDTGFNIIPQHQLHIGDVEETGKTFVENALIKARNAALHAQMPAIADDSGLEIDALNGEPGIHSARFSNHPEANIQKVLGLLQNVPENARTARFQCILVYLKHADDPTPLICQGTWEGSILNAPQGSGGFGYDPIFYVKSHRCSAAELLPEEKLMKSHRGQAMSALVKALR